jgi:hypothetical protein
VVGGASADWADWVELIGAGWGSGRLRMPISNELTDRNFVTKIARYHRVVDVPNSMTVLTDMLPLSLAMSAAGVGPSCSGVTAPHPVVLFALGEHGGCRRYVALPQCLGVRRYCRCELRSLLE